MNSSRNSGFALKDLVATIVGLSLITFVALPAANNRNTSSVSRCMSNMRHLIVAWQLYASDNEGRVVHNLHGGDATGAAGANRFSPWASGWQTWGTEPDNTNVLYIRNQRYARLGPYITTPDSVHKCPSDFYLSAAQRQRGWKERVRSVVMNGTIGQVNDGNIGPFDLQMYRRIKTTSELTFSGPNETSAFLEEHPDSMNDPLLFPPMRSSWIDIPGNLHSGASTVAFADGHVEVHPWVGPLRSAPVSVSSRLVTARAGDPDLSWLSY